jgi:hypothetical protein
MLEKTNMQKGGVVNNENKNGAFFLKICIW